MAEGKAAKRSPRRRAARHPAEEVRLTGDRLVVSASENGERRSRSGLLIPATAAQAPRRCVWAAVTLVGPDVRHVRTGDRVLFLPQAGLEVEIDGRDFLLLRERDVQAIASAGDDGGHPGPGQYL
jgi:chaperonin GroES